MSEARTLVLTPSMVANRIASWQEGVVLWYQEKAEILESYEATVSSPSMTLRIPAVMRLTRQVRRDRTQIKFSRQNIYLRDHHTCQYCGNKFPAKELTYDHVLPRCRGGRTTWQNIVAADTHCNRKKGRRTPAEAGMKLLRAPFIPKSLPHSGVIVSMDSCPDEWKPYLGMQDVA